MNENITTVLNDIQIELISAQRHGDKFASLHEAYAVMLEELEELWDITRMKRCQRVKEEIREELIQLAAMAVKGILSLESFVGGNV